MPRTTTELVAGIIEVDPLINLDPFILAANALVEQIAEGSELSTERLQLVETWLAAHFYTVRDPRTTAEKAGPVSASYQSAVALGLNTSHYGQMAQTLDTSGSLRALASGKRRPSVLWLGRTADERLLDPGP